jgi:hypothetical protein
VAEFSGEHAQSNGQMRLPHTLWPRHCRSRSAPG